MKRVLLLVAVLSGMVMSCKKSDTDKPGDATCYLTGYTVYYLDGITDSSITLLTFNEDGQLLSMDDEYLDRQLIYENGKLIRLEYAVNGNPSTFCDYQYNSSTGKLASAYCTGFDGNVFDTLQFITYTFNGDQLVEIDVVDSLNFPNNNYTRYFTYDGNKNIIQAITAHYNNNTLSNSDSLVYSYTYDNARAPYEGYPQPLIVDNATVNNRLTNEVAFPSGATSNYVYTYTYNEFNYPLERNETMNGAPHRKIVFNYSCDE